jgi:histidine triad (HIT) family protein
MKDCVFCRIARGEAPAHIVYRDEEVTTFHDLHPNAPVRF